MATKKGGLGASAWFEQASAVNEEPKSAITPQPQPKTTPQKTRKTFVILPDTYYLLSLIKAESQRNGTSITYGELLDEAVQDLAQKLGIETT